MYCTSLPSYGFLRSNLLAARLPVHTPFSHSLFSQIPFSQIPFSQIPFSQIPFSQIPFSQIPFSQIPFSQMPLVVKPFGCSIGDVFVDVSGSALQATSTTNQIAFFITKPPNRAEGQRHTNAQLGQSTNIVV